MKRYSIITNLLLPSLITLGIFSCKEFEDDLEIEGKLIPAVTLLFPDSTFKSGTADLPANKPTVLFCMSTECPHCRKQLQDIINNMKTLDDINFLLFTPDSFAAMRNYHREFNLHRFSNVRIGTDTGSSIVNRFQISTVPYLLFYDKNGRFVYGHVGNISIDSIKQIVSKDVIAQ